MPVNNSQPMPNKIIVNAMAIGKSPKNTNSKAVHTRKVINVFTIYSFDDGVYFSSVHYV